MNGKSIHYRHIPGSSCACVAWSGVGYAAVASSKFFDLSVLSTNLIDDLFINLGIYAKLYRYTDNYKCLEEIISLIDNNIPVALLLNPLYCKRLIKVTPEDVRQYLPTHWIVVTGYNSETKELVFYDNRQFNQSVISFENFIDGRNLYTGVFNQNPRNYLYHVCYFDKINPIDFSIKTSLEKTCLSFLEVQKELSFHIGSYGYEKCIRHIAIWNSIMPEENVRELLKKIRVSITGAGGVNGAYRRLFSRYLFKANDVLKESSYVKIAHQFADSALLWEYFVKTLDECTNSDITCFSSSLLGLSKIMGNIYKIEKEGMKNISKMI